MIVNLYFRCHSYIR